MMTDSRKDEKGTKEKHPKRGTGLFGIASINRSEKAPTDHENSSKSDDEPKKAPKFKNGKDHKDKHKPSLQKTPVPDPTELKTRIVPPKKKTKGPNVQITLWLRIGDWDPVPYEVDQSITLHDMKCKIHEDEEFELKNFKIHKMKCFDGAGKPLDPRTPLCEQVEDGSEVWLKLLGTHQDYTDSHPLADSSSNPPSRNMSRLPSREQLSSNGVTRHNTIVQSDVDPALKTTLLSLQSRVEALDKAVATKNEAFDDSVKKLSDLANQLKRMNGIPEITNELKPTYEGFPALRGKDMLGHDGPVWTLSHGTHHLFSGSSDTTVKVWDVNTGRVKHTLRGHTSIVHCVVAFNKDKTVVSGSDDKTIKIWDVESQSCSQTIRDDNIACVLRAHRGHLFSGSFKYVKVWNLATQTLAGVLPGHNHWVRAITLANGYCFSGGHNVIKVWDMAKFNCVRTMAQPCGSIYSVLVQGNMLYAGTYENTVNIWDLRSYEFVRSLPGHSGAVYALALHGNKLFSGSYDNSIRVWDLNTFKCVQRLTGHSSSVEALATAKDRLFSASTDQTIKVWRFPEDGQQ